MAVRHPAAGHLVRDSCSSICADLAEHELGATLGSDRAERQRVALSECLETTLSLFGKDLEGVVVTRAFGDVPAILCNPRQINQVFYKIEMAMGLALAYRIVADHDGDIRLQSEEGRGTKVIVEVPITRS